MRLRLFKKWTINLQVRQLVPTNGSQQGLVDHPKYRDNRLPFRLGYELGDDPDVVQGALGVGHAHHTVHEVDHTVLARMIVSCAKVYLNRPHMWYTEYERTILRAG